MKRFLSVGYTLASVEVATLWLHDIASEMGLDDRSCFRLEMLLNEALANVVMHARNACDDEGVIELSLERDAAGLLLQISDGGVPFDPGSAVPAARAATLSEATPGGRGLALIRHYSDHVEYVRAGDRNLFRARLLAPVTPQDSRRPHATPGIR